ncbi:hypothetical protein K493DRAFT_335366 [Basidiobolus meristosporus CBS 931.73]|uniref:Uncharacterized protein n=1 Tax=Basidiobolus meristosporus CBS 931.73 TaxID=1314790 RepID=A0A1Y1YRH0_9FUNG|nr:hypothetical protein K493DRAFT_335366 [Basidiobolus meristosporus CBS 931.73]|eukprot:ORY00414.1 hypothetical protein K493DRAFT_335366 [Basidiobolus meristosporus CBS 931.73]
MQPLALNLFALISLGFYNPVVLGLPSSLSFTNPQEPAMMDVSPGDSAQLQPSEPSSIMTLNQKLFNQMDQLKFPGDGSNGQIWASPHAYQPASQFTQDEKGAVGGKSESAESYGDSIRTKFQQKMSSVLDQAAETLNKKLDGFASTDPASTPPKT